MQKQRREETRDRKEEKKEGGADDDPVAGMHLRSTDRLTPKESLRRLHAETEMLSIRYYFFTVTKWRRSAAIASICERSR